MPDNRSSIASVQSSVTAIPLHAPKFDVPIPEKAGKARIFVSDSLLNALFGYQEVGGAPTYAVSAGLNQPQGLATDKSGKVYLANTNDYQILVFRPPSTKPVLTIPDPNVYPTGVAVDANGNIWVSNLYTITSPCCGPGNVQEYSSAGALEATIECANIYKYYFVAVDSKGNVAVDGFNISAETQVGYIASGTNSCVALSSITADFPGGLQFTHEDDLAVDDQLANNYHGVVTTYGKSPLFRHVIHVTEFNDAFIDPVTIALTAHDADIWTADAGANGGGSRPQSAGVALFLYPHGGSPSKTITGPYEPVGIAVRPPPRY
ncbi:MAG TPA: hypothetical protein VFE16_01240 [Candidatus Cybelea sp.]|jgi:DNA-binding beta-propeller fold protein YncE|nr:hypothetical protein [Candidatus Cybelea sp.]